MVIKKELLDFTGNPHRLPSWLRRPPGSCKQAIEVKRMLRRNALHTVCEEARCPNIAECFSNKTATFMILGSICTRNCGFCGVAHGCPDTTKESDPEESLRLVEAVRELALEYVVITSVTRDDLSDGGALAFASVVKLLHEKFPHLKVELLVPDFQGSSYSLELILRSRPDVLNHNLETVPRLYPLVRPEADYNRSIKLLREAKVINPQQKTKTGIMLGLGETKEEVYQLMLAARSAEVDYFTAGQYLQPMKSCIPVARYLSQEEFNDYQEMAQDVGYRKHYIGPLVRSSYHAEVQYGC